MTSKGIRPEQVAELRRQAEEIAREKAAHSSEDIKKLTPEEIRQMLHELRVHQIELEMQNEEMRQAQAELDAARVRYFDLYDLAPVGYFTVNETGLILEANLTAATQLGCTRNALVKLPITRFILKEDQDIYYRYRKRLIKTGMPQECDLRMLENDGTMHWARLVASVVQDADGAPVGRIVMSDITERKRAEDALTVLELRFRTVSRLSSDFSYSCCHFGGGQYVVDWITDTFYVLTGVSEAELKDLRCWMALAHPEDRDRATEPLRRLQPGERDTREFRIVAKDGRILTVRNHMECEADPTVFGGLRIHGAVQDITEYKKIAAENAELESQNRQLQKAESLGRMAGAIAHHFNNQLHVVMGNLEMAMDGLSPGENPVENLISAMQAARKASDVSSLMLTYLGQTTGKHEHIDLSEACRLSLPLIQAAAPKGTHLKANFPASGPVIRANASQILQILTNLVTNAWESADENRRGIGLTVKTVYQSDILALKRFPVNWQPVDSAYVCLEVTDTGCGIAENDIEKIFDPFFSTKFTGRGLGLSVVLGIVRAHHGAVTVESEPDRGSIFRVFFPVSVEEVLRQPDKAVQTTETEEGGTVLVVEDEEQVRYMVKTMLIHLGFTVFEAGDGIEAMDVFRQHLDEIHCVLTDLTMPRMDGWETLAALRKLSPDIPVILSSGYDQAQVMADEHPEVPNAFLGKPYRLQDLKDTIRHTLADKKKASPRYEPL